MGRELRRVRSDWQHPIDQEMPEYLHSGNESYYHRTNFIGLFDGNRYERDVKHWEAYKAAWDRGEVIDYSDPSWSNNDPNTWKWQPKPAEYAGTPYEEYDGAKPDSENYMPLWSDEERTHFQMYQTVTEGGPISPVFATAEELAQWLSEHPEGKNSSYESWLAFINKGLHAPSGIYIDGKKVNPIEYVVNL
jgi:hypothetical protein